MRRFHETGESLNAFRDAYLVQCPRCAGCATVHLATPEDSSLFAPRRFTCGKCGMAKELPKPGVVGARHQTRVDDYFHFPLWLQIPCGRHVLWANNWRHLDFIESYVQATLRERAPAETGAHRNRLLSSRLPKWIKDGKNRDMILSAIARLRNIPC